MTAAVLDLVPHQSPNVNHCTSCGDFMKIPPLVKSERDGKCYVNPDFDMVKIWHLEATPYGGSEGTIPAGESLQFSFTVQAEENSMGDMLINELLASFNAASPVRNVMVSFNSLQNDRLLSNAPVPNTLVFGTAQLACNIPCCLMLQATNTIVMTVQNNEAFAVECFFVARGKRFMPYHDPSLRGRMLAYWNSIPTTPFYLTIDTVGEVTGLPAGGTENVTMTVPGGGDFECKWPRCEVISAGATTFEDILITVSEGVGRQWSNIPLHMGRFVATPTLSGVSGFPNGGLYNAASACSGEQYTQFYKRNSRLRVSITNNGPAAATIRFLMAGCMHYVSECPPGRSLDRTRSLEPTIGPMLIQEGRACPPAQEYMPVPGRGMVPVSAMNAPAHAMLPPMPPPGMQLPGFPGQLSPAQLQGLGAMINQRQQLAAAQRAALMRGRQGPGPGHQFRQL
jgi:hypothetical protein